MTVKELMDILEKQMDAYLGDMTIGCMKESQFYAFCGYLYTKDLRAIALCCKKQYPHENSMTVKDLHNMLLHRITPPNELGEHFGKYITPDMKIVDDLCNPVADVKIDNNIVISFHIKCNWLISVVPKTDDNWDEYTFTGDIDECKKRIIELMEKTESVESEIRRKVTSDLYTLKLETDKATYYARPFKSLIKLERTGA